MSGCRMCLTPRLIEPTDAVVRVMRAAMCGSDLWAYRDGGRRSRGGGWDTSLLASSRPPAPSRDCQPAMLWWLRFCGPTAPVSSAVRACRASARREALGLGRLRRRPGRGGTCSVGRRHAGRAAGRRGRPADATLLTLSDVMGTGHHAAVAAESGQLHGRGRRRRRGRAVRGDCCQSGWAPSGSSPWAATRCVPPSGRSSVPPMPSPSAARGGRRVRELTGGQGAHAVLEAVGPEQSIVTALEIARPGGAVGCVGVPDTTRRPPALSSGTSPAWPVARHPCAPTSTSCYPTCSKDGSTPVASSTVPARSTTCRPATAR